MAVLPRARAFRLGCAPILTGLLALSGAHGSPAHAAGGIYFASPAGTGSTCSQAAPCSLVTAVTQAVSGADTIVLAPGTYVQTHVSLTASVTLQGVGAASTILDGGGSAGSVIRTNAGVSAILRDLTVQGGTGTPIGGLIAGGGILANGPLTLNGVTVRNNHIAAGAVTGEGGGIASPVGGVALVASTVSGNSVSSNFLAQGGGIEGGGDTLKGSVISGNSVSGGSEFALGGGIDGDGNSLTNSSILGNAVSNASNGAPADGGGINGTANVLTTSVVSGNTVTTAVGPVGGGGIEGGGNTLMSSVIDGNRISGIAANGGGIDGGGNTVTNSTISANTATDTGGGGASGGGIGAGGNNVVNSTISGNSATSIVTGGTAFGGGIEGGGDFLTNATIGNNTAVGSGLAQGGGVDGNGEIIANSIFSGNTANGTPADCNGGVGVGDDLGGNLADDATCHFTPAGGPTGSLNGISLALGPLQDNGGPLAGAPGNQKALLTQALPPGSPAINHGVVAICTAPLPTASSFPPNGAGDVDERGISRHAVTRNACDSGALDTGGTVANPAAVTGALNLLAGSGWRLGFAASTDPTFSIGYITFQQGANSLVARRPISLSCTGQCGGTVANPALGTSTVTLGGTVSSAQGGIAIHDNVLVALTVTTTRGAGAGANYAVIGVMVQVFAPNGMAPLLSVSASAPFNRQSGVIFRPLGQMAAP